MAVYPSKQEVLEHVQKHPPDQAAVETVLQWKSANYTNKWNSCSDTDKKIALQILISALWTQNPRNRNKSKQTPMFVWGDEWHYQVDRHLIQGENGNYSIISSLHELGHALLGTSEHQACGYSVGLFMACFPKEYAKLRWEGHMLKP